MLGAPGLQPLREAGLFADCVPLLARSSSDQHFGYSELVAEHKLFAASALAGVGESRLSAFSSQREGLAVTQLAFSGQRRSNFPTDCVLLQ